MHYAEPYYPFDAVLPEFLLVGFSQASARLFAVPTSLGLECRILNGYVYLSGNSVTDEATIARRAELFERRGGYYYERWDELDAKWREKVETEIHELEAHEVPALPEVEDESLVREARGCGSAHRLLVAYDRLLEGLDRICHYHFELVNLGYGAYLAFYEVCRKAFPDISDQTIAKMVTGIDVVTLRPDDELQRLARLAVELGLAAQVKGAGGEEALRAALTGSEQGERWLGDFEADEAPLVQLLLRQRALPPPPLLDRRPDAPDRDDRLLHRAPRGRRGDRTALVSRWSSSAIGSPTSIAPFFPRRFERRSTSSLLSPALCSPTSRTTTSISITGTTPFSGTRCASSARSSHGTGFWPTRRTSSSCATTRCDRRSTSSGFFWSSGRCLRGPRPGALARDRRAPQADLCGDARMGAATCSRHDARRDHGAGHDHALGHHDRTRPRNGSNPPPAPPRTRCGELRAHQGSSRASPK